MSNLASGNGTIAHTDESWRGGGLADSTEIETFLKTQLPEHASGSLAHELRL